MAITKSNKKNEELSIKEDKVKPKEIITIVVAVLASLLLVYVLYNIFLKRDVFLIEKLSVPTVILEEKSPSLEGSKESVATEFKKIEKSLKDNSKFQSLEEFGDLPVQVGEVGNPNPFRPFISTSITPRIINTNDRIESRSNSEDILSEILSIR